MKSGRGIRIPLAGNPWAAPGKTSMIMTQLCAATRHAWTYSQTVKPNIAKTFHVGAGQKSCLLHLHCQKMQIFFCRNLLFRLRLQCR